MRKTHNQKIAYALNRLSKSVDRVILSTNEDKKARARSWVLAWNLVAQKSTK